MYTRVTTHSLHSNPAEVSGGEDVFSNSNVLHVGDIRVKPYRVRRRPGGRWEVSTAGGDAMLVFDSIADLRQFTELVRIGSEAAMHIAVVIQAAERKGSQRSEAGGTTGAM